MSDAPFVARVSRARVLFHVLLVLAFTGLLVVLAARSVAVPSENLVDYALPLFAAGVALMFLYGAFSIGRSLFYRGDLIVVDAQGICMPSCYQGVLPWSALARAAVLKGRLHFWLAKDATTPPGKGLAHVLRTNSAISRAADAPDLAVTTWLADRRTDELVEAVRARAPQLFA